MEKISRRTDNLTSIFVGGIVRITGIHHLPSFSLNCRTHSYHTQKCLGLPSEVIIHQSIIPVLVLLNK